MHVFAVLPPFAGAGEITDVRMRYWVLPITQYASDPWVDWEVPAPSPSPWTEPEDGLLTGPLDADRAGDAIAELLGDLDADGVAEAAEEPLGGLDSDDDAEAIVEQPSGGPHPVRVAFAPDDLVDELIGGQDARLVLFGDANGVRFGRPYELWFEAKMTVLPDGEDAEPEELVPERVIFPLTGASEAVSIVTDDCLRLNREATFDSESSSHLLDGFAVDPPTP